MSTQECNFSKTNFIFAISKSTLVNLAPFLEMSSSTGKLWKNDQGHCNAYVRLVCGAIKLIRKYR